MTVGINDGTQNRYLQQINQKSYSLNQLALSSHTKFWAPRVRVSLLANGSHVRTEELDNMNYVTKQCVGEVEATKTNTHATLSQNSILSI